MTLSSFMWRVFMHHLQYRCRFTHPSIFYTRLIHRSGRGGAGAYPSGQIQIYIYGNFFYIGTYFSKSQEKLLFFWKYINK